MDIDLTDAERDLILQMRDWPEGVPDDALGRHKESPVFVHLVAARAELYRLAVVHGHNDLVQRHEAFHNTLSPGLVLQLCRAWQDLRDREICDETF